MGVAGLWELLRVAARRVSVESVHGYTLAVDASIWLIQFNKAMRDEHGNVLPKAHLIGCFRRICKLLFHGVKPILVFDGGTPALKRQTLRSRRARRQSSRANLERAARKLLLVQMQRRKLLNSQQMPSGGDKLKTTAEETRGVKRGSSAKFSLPACEVSRNRRGFVHQATIAANKEAHLEKDPTVLKEKGKGVKGAHQR